jgi:hypothetical protein
MKQKEPTNIGASSQAGRDAILDETSRREGLTSFAWPALNNRDDAQRAITRGAWIMLIWGTVLAITGVWFTVRGSARIGTIFGAEVLFPLWLGLRIQLAKSTSAALAGLTATCFAGWQLIRGPIVTHLPILGPILGLVVHGMINCVRGTRAYGQFRARDAAGLNRRSKVLTSVDVILMLLFILSGLLSIN